MRVLRGEAYPNRLTIVLTVVSVLLLCFLLLLFGSLGTQRRPQRAVASVEPRMSRSIPKPAQSGVQVTSPISKPVERAGERRERDQSRGEQSAGRIAVPSQPAAGSKSVPLYPPVSVSPPAEYRLEDQVDSSEPRRVFVDFTDQTIRLPAISPVVPIGSMVMPTFANPQNPVTQVVSQEPATPKKSGDEKAKKPVETSAEAKTEAKTEAKATETETIGVPPPREQPQFLRNDSILMEPGSYQWEIGMSYARNLSQSPIGQILGDTAFVGNLRRVNRVLQMPLELRIGLTSDLQGSISLPVGLANQEVSIGGTELTDDSFGIGDLSLGLTRLIRQGDLTEPNVLGFLSLSVPTGQASLATSLDDPSISLGRGFYSLTTGLTFTKTYDPLVFFSGFGYQHNFEDSFSGVGRLNPGNGGFYRLGVGYAVNSNVSLSTAFTGSFLGNAEVNGVRLGGTSREPLSLRIAATIVNKKKSVRKARTIEPFVNLGLNEDATDTILGVSWTY